MPIATDRLIHGKWTKLVPLTVKGADPVDVPKWHSLRLFGAGRHPRGFNAGAERRAEL